MTALKPQGISRAKITFPPVDALIVQGRQGMKTGASRRWCSTSLQIRGSCQPFAFVGNQNLIYNLKSSQLIEVRSQVLEGKMKLSFIFPLHMNSYCA